MAFLIFTIFLFININWITATTSEFTVEDIQQTKNLNYSDPCSRIVEEYRLEVSRYLMTTKEKYKPREPILKERMEALFNRSLTSKSGPQYCDERKLLSCGKDGRCGCGTSSVLAVMGEEYGRSLYIRENGECRLIDGGPCDFVNPDVCKAGTKCLTSFNKKLETCTVNATAPFLKEDFEGDHPFQDSMYHISSGEMCTCQVEMDKTGGGWHLWILAGMGVLGVVGYLLYKLRKPQLGFYAS